MKKFEFNGKLVEAVIVDFTGVAEPWETFELDDGTVIKVRATPTQILRIEGEFDAGGNPVYSLPGVQISVRIVKTKLSGKPTLNETPTKPAARDISVG